MSKVTIYHNPRCSKSRQTKGLLDEKGVDYEVVEYLKDTPGTGELAAILLKLGKSPLEVMRTKEPLFKELGLSKSDDRSDAEWLKIMVENPKLIERPIVVNGDKAAMGRPPEDVLEII
ncbi:MAG: arsenate reductase (glutaredoxin) [Gammaproteobacteria bacterium]|nr:arsenate reductase (glutaredoxin) [Gammaproteobacteria bacterium]